MEMAMASYCSELQYLANPISNHIQSARDDENCRVREAAAAGGGGANKPPQRGLGMAELERLSCGGGPLRELGPQVVGGDTVGAQVEGRGGDGLVHSHGRSRGEAGRKKIGNEFSRRRSGFRLCKCARVHCECRTSIILGILHLPRTSIKVGRREYLAASRLPDAFAIERETRGSIPHSRRVKPHKGFVRSRSCANT